ncbi:uncharacterized protein PFL1_04325 [Pseudozyma flocculosa PF-1]|uniref:Ubiquitin-like domain-containing protein n=1 Tax=Pseudozyma flocculosa PF-1 TaxID=1277687 RepID=A0A061H5X3_9BASI|nr:uncharacterized protein PFL1_04325 [Pseudozyma flocculosa PF-1]EPQ27998.1 hypothetical protein PFL1_04325 [Pseudozyma flocculosa PF-1]
MTPPPDTPESIPRHSIRLRHQPGHGHGPARNPDHDPAPHDRFPSHMQAATDSGATDSHFDSPPQGQHPFRPFPSSSSSSSGGGGTMSLHHSAPPSTPGSAPMSRAPSLSALDISADVGEGVLLSIKCPSLVRDSARIRFHPDTTVLQIKQSIERTWPGKPRSQGLRFIRAGRLLADTETVAEFAVGTDPSEPVSVHLVIRPDAWLDPKNRPTPSRRSSYLRQVPLASPLLTPGLRDISSSYFTTLPTSSPLQSQRTSPRAQPTPLPEDRPVPSGSHSSVSTASTRSSGATPVHAPSTTRPGRLSRQSSRSGDGADMHGFGGGMWWNTAVADFALPARMTTASSMPPASDDHDKFRQILMATAPANYPLLVDSATLLHDVYLERYRRLYRASQKGQLSGEAPVSALAGDGDGEESDDDNADEDEDVLSLAQSVEDELFGWEPIDMPALDRRPDVPGGKELEYLYHEVQCNGLPYLLQLAVTPSDRQRSAAMSQLLGRMERLASTIKLLNSLTMHASLLAGAADVAPFAPSAMSPASGTALSPDLHAQLPARAAVAAAAPPPLGGADPQNPQPRGRAAAAQLVPVAWRSTFAGLAELTWNEIFSMTVPLFFLGLKLGIFLYVFGRGASDMKRFAMMAAASIYVVWEAVKLTNDPLAPLPPVHAPRRYTTSEPSLLSVEHWLERIAYIGMESEDEDLGLLPPLGSPRPAARTRRRGRVFHHVVVPLVLFFATLVPDIEMKRRRAIEEREDVVRDAVSKAEERIERIRAMQRDDAAQAQAQAQAQGEEGRDKVLKEYSDRILARRRGGTAAAGMDGRDAEALRAAVRADEDDEGEMQFF